ncbi:hypothetical protein D039_2295A, partial [Vibrio parahaemolyticus EKP-028]
MDLYRGLLCTTCQRSDFIGYNG